MTSIDVTGQNDSTEPAEQVEPIELTEPVELVETPEPAEPIRSPFRVVSIDELKPAAARPQPEPVAPAPADVADNQRWHDILLGFIDDPRGSVAEAADLVEADVTALIAVLSRRRDAMAERWQAEKPADAGAATEDLRLALRGYRDFSRQLAASLKALS